MQDLEVRDVKRGNFGIVYIVYDRRAKTIMALKSFQDKYFEIGGAQAVLEFHAKTTLWRGLGKHENIIEAYLCAELERKPHLLMEYVDGGNLRERLEQGRFSVPEALFFAIQFCDGIIYAKTTEGMSGVDIVHGDIKPENIMLTKEDVLKVTDFRLLMALEHSMPERPAGAPPYMSPELFARGSYVGEPSEIYSFGVVLYEMLTGERPFKGLGPKEYEEQHRHETAAPPRTLSPSIPDELEKTVLKCLEKRSSVRYQRFEDLRRDLMEVCKTQFGQISEVEKRIRNLTAIELFNTGHFHGEIGRADRSAQWRRKAVEFFDKALKINPRLAYAWKEKGDALVGLGFPDRAVECYNRALEIDPRYADAWLAKGWHLEAGSREKHECFRKAAEIKLAIPATIDIYPNTLDLKSKSKWATCYIELFEGYDVANIDVPTVRLDGFMPVDRRPHHIQAIRELGEYITKVGDYDGDGVPDLMVKFERAAVIEYIRNELEITDGEITLLITGQVAQTPFKGTGTIRVIS